MTSDYLLTSLIIILLPGTGVLYTLALGLGRGWQASAIAAFGCTLGILPHIAVSIVGLAALLHASAMAFQGIKYLGVAYLLYMAWGVWRDGGALQVEAEGLPIEPLAIIRNGILLNILNPKLSIFFLAFLPQFVPASAPHPTAMMLELALVFMALTFVVFLLYGAFAAAARRSILSRPRVLAWLRRSFAAAFAVLGLKLALTQP
ncbi:lysine transporter LysE [Labrys miyagiensis]|uniref:Lysine transporter LysE n=1 Tax=Labrys miyagiensis TaxID=346912 RepID=A0ABQ6CRV9_9HYPH|nr:LysE family translocator [Labrys miyagiensis]GLS23086.1 lysine transporter LysE [Labrys miyagiensis]